MVAVDEYLLAKNGAMHMTTPITQQSNPMAAAKYAMSLITSDVAMAIRDNWKPQVKPKKNTTNTTRGKLIGNARKKVHTHRIAMEEQTIGIDVFLSDIPNMVPTILDVNVPIPIIDKANAAWSSA